MKDSSSTISVTKGSAWIAREPDGRMTVGTFTDYRVPIIGPLYSNVRTTKRWTLQGGWPNWIGNVLLRGLIWVASSTSGEVRSAVLSSTQHSPSDCLCGCLNKPDTANA